LLASDQHPDHDVQAGECFIGSVYNAIIGNPELWRSTLLLITYDEHGGIYDHVPPPACNPAAPDGFKATADKTGTGFEFTFDRLGVRVPAVLVSPWIPKGTVIPGPEDPLKGRTFEHASIPNTVMKFFHVPEQPRTAREKAADTFLDFFSDDLRPASDCPVFDID
jgi:phospholipase C